jgi:hypothetical protein
VLGELFTVWEMRHETNTGGLGCRGQPRPPAQAGSLADVGNELPWVTAEAQAGNPGGCVVD